MDFENIEDIAPVDMDELTQAEGVLTDSVDPPWKVTSDAKLKIIWSDVIDNARQAGVSLTSFDGKVEFTEDDVPSAFSKVGYIEGFLDLMIRYPNVPLGIKDFSAEILMESRAKGPKIDFYDWLDDVYEKEVRRVGYLEIGKARLTKIDELETLKDKYRPRLAKFSAKPYPTQQAKNYSLWDLKEYVNEVREQLDAQTEDSILKNSEFKDEFYGKEWNLKVAGAENPVFPLLALSALTASSAPWSVFDGIPREALDYGFNRVLNEELMYENEINRMVPSHFLVGTNASAADYSKGNSTIRIGNPGGAEGMPAANRKNAREFTSDGNRPTKGNSAYEDVHALADWCEAGCPQEGPEWDAMNTLVLTWFRSDGKVDPYLLAFCAAMERIGDLRPMMLLGGRGIAIVSGRLTMGESGFVQPCADRLNALNIKTLDQRSTFMAQSMSVAMTQMTEQYGLSDVGGDSARYDWALPTMVHAYETALLLRQFTLDKVPLLFGAGSAPGVFSEELISELVESIPVGGSDYVTVNVPDPETGVERLESVLVRKVLVDVPKMICGLVSAVNGPAAWCDFVIEGESRTLHIPLNVMLSESELYDDDFRPDLRCQCDEKDPFDSSLTITVSGGRRSGSNFTSYLNGCGNGGMLYSAFWMLRRFRRFRGLIHRRCREAGLPTPDSVVPGYIQKIIRRGDDVRLVHDMVMYKDNKRMKEADVTGIVFACATMYGNPVKQEQSNTPGVTKVGYSAKVADRVFPRSVTLPQRSCEQYLSTEPKGVDLIDLWKDLTEADLDIDINLAADQASAISRLLPVLGGPIHGEPVPGGRDLIRHLAALDKYNLSSNIKDMTASQVQAFIERQATVFANRQARKQGLTDVETERLKREYLNSDIHKTLLASSAYREELLSSFGVKRSTDRFELSFEEAVSHHLTSGEN